MAPIMMESIVTQMLIKSHIAVVSTLHCVVITQMLLLFGVSDCELIQVLMAHS